MTILDPTYDDSTYDDGSLAGGCCCASVDSEPDVIWEDWDTSGSAEVWTQPLETLPEPPAPPVDAPLQPVETQSVIPAGQPGGPAPVAEVQSVMPAGQPGGPVEVDDAAGLYPSVATIGGDPLATAAPAYVESAYVGGGDPYGISIVDSTGAQLTQPGSMIIGPPTETSAASALAQVYGIAAQNGDVMSQILVQKTLDSMNRSTLIWTL
jgi:hypothetical protein